MLDGKIAVGVRAEFVDKQLNSARGIHIISETAENIDPDNWWDDEGSDDIPKDVTAFDRIGFEDGSRLAVVGYEAISGKINLAFSYRWPNPAKDESLSKIMILPNNGTSSIKDVVILGYSESEALVAINQGRMIVYQVDFNQVSEFFQDQAVSIEISKPASISTGQQTLIRQGFEASWDLVAYDVKAQKLIFYKALLNHSGVPFWSLKPQSVDLKGLADFTRLNDSSWNLMTADETSVYLTNSDGFVYRVPLEGVFNP
jgi:hypothetical protein